MFQNILIRPIYRIVILRALHLGDLLCSVPAFRALRATFPDAEISLVGLPWAHEFVTRFNHYLDRLIEFPGYPGLPEKPFEAEKFPAFIQSVQNRRFDLAIQMQGCGNITNPLVELFHAKRTAGYYRPGDYCPNQEFFLPYLPDFPEVWRHISLMQKLGALSHGDHLEFPILKGDIESFSTIAEKHALVPGRFICIHAGARSEKRRWPIECFTALAREIHRREWKIVLTGSHEEISLVSELASQITSQITSQIGKQVVGEIPNEITSEIKRRKVESPCVNLAGKTSLGVTAALLRNSIAVICNDTGISHLAVATETPSIVLFLDSDRVGWPPLNRQRHRVLSRLTGITPQDVLQELDDLLLKELPNQTIFTIENKNDIQPRPGPPLCVA